VIRKKLGVVIAVAMVAAACGGGTSDAVGTQSTTDTTAAEEVADHHEGEEDVADHGHEEEAADHHEGEEDVADHEHEEEAADHHDGEEAGNRVVEVSMTEFSFDVEEFHVARHDTVSFVVTNNGRVDHEFRVTTEHAALEHIQEHQGDHADHAGGNDHHEEHFVVVAPGATETLSVAFHDDADFDVVACLLPGHWEAGLHTPLTVEG
jgi:uncharacterized cupredoxin-like copper-binding protein